MSDDFKLQLSVNIPSGEQYEKGDMLNIRANNPDEFMAMLAGFQNANVVQACAEAAANIKAAYLVVRDMGGQRVEHSQNPQNGPQNPPQNNGGWQGQQQQSGPQNGSQGFQGQQGGYQQQQQPNNGWQGQQQGGYQGGGNSGPANNGVPTSPPPHVGPAPSCSHGVKSFLAKNYKGGKPGYWMAWACPADKNDPTQHDLEFIRQGNR